MDRTLTSTEIRKKRGRYFLFLLLGIATLFLLSWRFGAFLKASVNVDNLQIATAELGAIQNTLPATAEVIPEFEEIIASPLTATILSVYRDEGASLSGEETIMDLDKRNTQTEFEHQKDQLALKRNSIIKLKLELDQSFNDLKIQDSIKAYKINALKAELEHAKRLFKAGGGTKETIEKYQNDLRIAELEKRQLEYDLKSRQAITKATIRESEINAGIQEKKVHELQQKLEQTAIKATREGVLTYVNKNIGSKVLEGDVLARLAGLSSFKLLGAISNSYAEMLEVGMNGYAVSNQQQFPVAITKIYPAVKNNVITFELEFLAEMPELLRPEMKIDIFLVTASKDKVVRIKNGPGIQGGAFQDLFVLQPNGKAEKRTLQLGLTNLEFVEVISGLEKGEQVIISDLSAYQDLQTLEVVE